MTKTTARTNIFISEDARALLSALGAAVTGRPSMAAGLAELVSRVTEGVTAYPSGPKGQYKAYWLHPGQAKDDPATDNQFTEYAYPSRAEATAAAVLLRYEEARARALAAQPEPEQINADEDHGLTLRATIGARNFGANVEKVQPEPSDEGAAVLAEQAT
jgi:hypothetical protein